MRENCETVEEAARFVPVAFGDITPLIEDIVTVLEVLWLFLDKKNPKYVPLLF